METKTDNIGDVWYVIIAGNRPNGVLGDPVGTGNNPLKAHKNLVHRIKRESGLEVTTELLEQSKKL